MSFSFRMLLLLIFSCVTHAEQAAPPVKPEPKVQVYTKQSNENVEALNHATEVLRDPSKALPLPETPSLPEIGKTVDKVQSHLSLNREPAPLRDPTQMSGNFRQALKNISTSGANNANPNTAANAPPSNAAPLSIPAIELVAKLIGKNKRVVLKINNRIIQLNQGGSFSLVDNQQVITVKVDKIDNNQVKISLLPINKLLTLQ